MRKWKVLTAQLIAHTVLYPFSYACVLLISQSLTKKRVHVCLASLFKCIRYDQTVERAKRGEVVNGGESFFCLPSINCVCPKNGIYERHFMALAMGYNIAFNGVLCAHKFALRAARTLHSPVRHTQLCTRQRLWLHTNPESGWHCPRTWGKTLEAYSDRTSKQLSRHVERAFYECINEMSLKSDVILSDYPHYEMVFFVCTKLRSYFKVRLQDLWVSNQNYSRHESGEFFLACLRLFWRFFFLLKG